MKTFIALLALLFATNAPAQTWLLGGQSEHQAAGWIARDFDAAGYKLRAGYLYEGTQSPTTTSTVTSPSMKKYHKAPTVSTVSVTTQDHREGLFAELVFNQKLQQGFSFEAGFGPYLTTRSDDSDLKLAALGEAGLRYDAGKWSWKIAYLRVEMFKGSGDPGGSANLLLAGAGFRF